MPPREADCFQDRAAVRELERALDGGGTAVLCQVLSGMGGVGKTQLAAHHARRVLAAGGVDLLVWATAATREAVVAAYAQAAAGILYSDPDLPETAAREFLAWLEHRPGPEQRRWMVVLDDVADPADLRGLWPPASPLGRTLVTTRRRDAALTGPGRRLVPVGLFRPVEARAYLAASLAARGRHEPEDELDSLAGELGYLPLALSQAAAYLIDSGLDCAAYRALLADRARDLADALPDAGALPDDQAAPLDAAWSLSADRADRLRPYGLARPMLRLAAMLDPNGIPASVLTCGPALSHLAAHLADRAAGHTPDRFGPPGRPAPPTRTVTAEEAVGALRALHRLSLIEHSPGTPHRAVRVHQLIQRIARDSLGPGRRDALARTAADALMAAWPEVERDTALAQALRANTDALARYAEEALYRPETHPLLFRSGRSLGSAGQVAAALAHFQHLADSVGARFGPDHPDTLNARHRLAHWHGMAGKIEYARTALTGVLADYLRVLGPDHPGTLGVRHNLARWRGAAGDTTGARTAFAELFTDRLRVIGPDHPDTLATRHELAHLRGRTGDHAGAIATFTDLLADCLRLLDPDHPRTLAARHELARWRGASGDIAGAGAAFAELLTDRLRIIGPDHPDTLATRHELAHLRGKAGDRAGAVETFTGILTDYLTVLGPDHPGTLGVRHNLARWRGAAGDPAAAVAALTDLLADRLQILGPQHPSIAATRADLAYWRGRAETGGPHVPRQPPAPRTEARDQAPRRPPAEPGGTG
ncbi:tetratricopeptide repeat protein [Streptomyces sp. SS8]